MAGAPAVWGSRRWISSAAAPATSAANTSGSSRLNAASRPANAGPMIEPMLVAAANRPMPEARVTGVVVSAM
jgi:hypothetical protein